MKVAGRFWKRAGRGAYFREDGDLRILRNTPKQELLSYIIGAVMLAVLVYGCVQFYDAPFRECANGYCGKGGKLHTASEYRVFNIWQAAVLIVWPISMGVVMFLQRNRLRV